MIDHFFDNLTDREKYLLCNIIEFVLKYIHKHGNAEFNSNMLQFIIRELDLMCPYDSGDKVFRETVEFYNKVNAVFFKDI